MIMKKYQKLVWQICSDSLSVGLCFVLFCLLSDQFVFCLSHRWG